MQKLDDHTPHDWIAEATKSTQRWPKFKKNVGVTVSSCVPPSYEAYAKILHPIYANHGAGPGMWWADMRPRRSVKEFLKGLIGRGDPWERITREATLVSRSAGDDERQERLTWKEVADAMGVTYHAQMTTDSFTTSERHSWPAQYFSPDEGDLGAEFTLRLADLLDKEQQCYFHYDLISGHDEDWEGDTLYLGTLEELPAWLAEHDHKSPTTWWPEDRSWCVYTDEDLTFTLVGGARDLIDRILSDDVLEAFESAPTHRVDNYADTINGPAPYLR